MEVPSLQENLPGHTLIGACNVDQVSKPNIVRHRSSTLLLIKCYTV